MVSSVSMAVLSLAERREIELKIARLRAANETLMNEIATLGTDIERAEDEILRLSHEKQRISDAMLTDGEIVVAAKEAEIARLTRTQEELSKSLQDEIAKGIPAVKEKFRDTFGI